jgi:hypothetical protein
MSDDGQSVQRYSVHARHADRRHARVVEEASFEAAAVAYAEDLAEAADGGGEISLVVRDLADGREHCFTIHLDTGDAAPCG